MRRISITLFTILGLALAVGLAFAASPYASPSPDGLEKVAETKGFLDDARLNAIQDDSPIPDYVFPGVGDERIATGLAGFVGVLAVFAVAAGIGWLFRRRSQRRLPVQAGA